MPEEYQPHGKGSERKGFSSYNYTKVNQSQILQKSSEIPTVQEKLETSSQRIGDTMNNENYLGLRMQQSRREGTRLEKQQTVTRFIER